MNIDDIYNEAVKKYPETLKQLSMKKEQRPLLLIIIVGGVSLLSCVIAIVLGIMGHKDAATSILLTVYAPTITLFAVLIALRELRSLKEEEKHRDYYYEEEQRKREAYLKRYWEEENRNK